MNGDDVISRFRHQVAERLRERAEKMLASGSADGEEFLEESSDPLVHELRVHQIELEMQNEELRQAQMELETSHAKYFDLYDLAPIGYFTMTEKGLVREVNLTLASMLGYDRAAMVRQPVSSFIVPEDHDHYFKFRKKILGSQEAQSFEMRMLRKDGTEIWVQCDAQTLGSSGRTLKTSRVAVTNITERKKLEAALRTALQKAQESERLKRAFLENLSHEFRTPMNAIIGFSDVLASSGLTPEQRQHYAGLVQRSGSELLLLLDNLIDVSLAQSGELEKREAEDSVNEVMRRVETLFRVIPAGGGGPCEVDLRFVFLSEDVHCSADFQGVERVLANLLNNALKFTEMGFVECGCKFMPDHLLCFYVRDTGLGIPKNMQDKIFETFVQVEDNRRRNTFGGLGLGLSIATKIVEGWNGKMSVESEPGVGSTFSFSLPIKNRKMV
jgi:PAS domain S-box-containing protein